MVSYRVDTIPNQDELTALYDSVGWAAYTRDPQRLAAGISASLAVVTAWDDDRLVGLARVVGDGLTIVYLQDILVVPEHQRSGIGRELFRLVFEPFGDVRQKLLLTDDEPRQTAFYEAMGSPRCVTCRSRFRRSCSSADPPCGDLPVRLVPNLYSPTRPYWSHVHGTDPRRGPGIRRRPRTGTSARQRAPRDLLGRPFLLLRARRRGAHEPAGLRDDRHQGLSDDAASRLDAPTAGG
nr:GNAT family N-acetyltransferase [Tessaracoccus coleopterorum]